MSTSEIFLIAIVLIMGLPYLIWRVGRTDYWVPLVVVQIVTGILLGPGVLGAVAPSYYSFVFNPQVIGALNGVAWWGVMIFVWIAGIEVDLADAWQHRGETVGTAALALVVPLIFGSAAGLLMVQSSGWAGPGANDWQVVLGIGMACAVTALPILILFLDKLRILREPFGQRILRCASLDDVAIWAVLAVILFDWERVGRQAAFIAGFALAAVAMRAAMKRLSEPDRWYCGLVWLAACGFVADWAGLHYMVGAFLAGAVLDAKWFDRTKMDLFRDHILLAIMPVFFLSTGLRTNWALGGPAVFGAAALLLAASVGGKLAGVHLAGRIFHWPRGEATIVGFLLQTKALIMIIFANVLLDRGVITAATFTALLLMALGSTVLTIPIVTPRLKRQAASVRASAPRRPPPSSPA